VLIEPPILSEASPMLINILTAVRRLLGFFSQVGGIRLAGRLSLMRFLFGGVDPPPELSERAGFLYRPQSVQASIYETQALPETIRYVNQSASEGAWGDWPVVILAANRAGHFDNKLLPALNDLAQLSTNGRVVTVESSHFIHFEHPQTVVSAIESVVQAARSFTIERPGVGSSNE
jgi:hypothetical protein